MIIVFQIKGGTKMKIIFKNLTQSSLTKKVVRERFASIIEKFPDLNKHEMRVTLEMENSPVHPGLDTFSVRVFVNGQKYKGLKLLRKSDNLYSATAEVIDGMLELLNRAGDKLRVKSRSKVRKFKNDTQKYLNIAS
jgi:ribosome-associated translation inhibitor RaiA